MELENFWNYTTTYDNLLLDVFLLISYYININLILQKELNGLIIGMLIILCAQKRE
jgi:hypothetical protein